MSHIIQYKLNQGDVLTYEKEVTLLLQEPDGTASKGTLVEDMIQTVLTGQEDGAWKVRLNMKTTKFEGALAPEPPDELKERETVLRMDAQGTLLEVESATSAPSVPAFPTEALETGQTWTALAPAPGSGQAFEVGYFLEEFKEVDGDTQAQVVSTGASRNEEEACTIETQSSMLFSVSHGHQLESATVVKMNWDDGRVSHTVVEVKLRNRS